LQGGLVRPDSPNAAIRRVANRIAELRREKGITQDQMAEGLRCATKNYQRIEYGQNVTIKTLTRIANLLGVTVTDLVPPPLKRRPPAATRAKTPATP
jgi:transcriptional regulator with XRE-family HTH domain